MAKVILVALGSTARADCLAEAIQGSVNSELYSYLAVNNPGVAARSKEVVLGQLNDFAKLQEYAKRVKPDFAVLSPDEAMAIGVADKLEEIGVRSFGPKKNLARLESSKGFARELLANYGIPGNPEYKVFFDHEDVKEYLAFLKDFVIKPDGLTGGKGVKVSGEHLKTADEAVAYCEEVLKSHPMVVVEEKLEGEEFSVQCFTDGKTVVACPVAQDHKRALDGDAGPNTGGMGSISDANHSLPFLEQKHVDEAVQITQKVAEALLKECGEPFRGIMYGGFMLTSKGVRLLEYNARFGDPEAMNVLPLLKSDFVAACQSCIDGSLSSQKVEFEKKASVVKYVVANGYPGAGVKGQKIDLTEARRTSARLYLGSVNEVAAGNSNQFTTGGGRAVACVGIADSLEEAEKIAEEAASKIAGLVYHRKDIGTRELLQKRIDHIVRIRPAPPSAPLS